LVVTKNTVSWDVAPCGSCNNRCFVEKYQLQRKGEKNQRARNNVSSNKDVLRKSVMRGTLPLGMTIRRAVHSTLVHVTAIILASHLLQLLFFVIKYVCCLMRRHAAQHSQDEDSRLQPPGFWSVTRLSFLSELVPTGFDSSCH
jgi:hypothetical protein